MWWICSMILVSFMIPCLWMWLKVRKQFGRIEKKIRDMKRGSGSTHYSW